MMTERMRTATEVAQPIHLLVLGDLPTRCWMGWDTARNLQQGDTRWGRNSVEFRSIGKMVRKFM